jgi:hypothetical protein
MKVLILSSLTGALALMMLTACNSSGSSTALRATGVPYEIAVVTNRNIWDGAPGQLLRDELLQSVPGLPQSEPSMRITYVEPGQFDGMLKNVRNILIVTVDDTQYTKTSLRSERDRWASGQVIVHITSPDAGSLAAYLERNPRQLVDFFTKVEMARAVQVLEGTHSSTVAARLKEKFGITLHVPADMNASRDTADFFWTSNNANTGRMDIVVYSFPYTHPNTFSKAFLMAQRDAILGANIPGSFPGSHMATDTALVSYSAATQQGKYCGVLRGLWHMKGDMMGGPFVSYARLDESSNRIIVAEGFVYSPETDKRIYIRRLEGSLHTLRLSGDTSSVLPVKPELED